MAVLARRPFKFAGRDLQVGDPVVGMDGETPDGGLYKRLHRAGLIYVADEPGVEVSGPAEHKQAERAARSKRQASKALGTGDDD